jgi:SSS family solute:Na+ symporter/sodium/proline symporter
VNYFLWIILAYLLVLMGFNFYKAKKVKSQEDFMVAGRSLSLTKMVFTLVCTWIGSGTFIAGAEYAARAGWSSLWLPAGAWFGIVVIYFLAAKIRTFGQYTVGDILEERYGKFARVFGAIALIVAFTTIVSYQFRAGGYILNVLTNGAVSVYTGQAIAALFVILFTALGGMVAVAHTDLPNGIIIVLASCIAVPFTIAAAGGPHAASAALPGIRRGFRHASRAQGGRILPRDLPAADGRPVDVPEVLLGEIARRGEARRCPLDRRHDRRRDGRRRHRDLRRRDPLERDQRVPDRGDGEAGSGCGDAGAGVGG